MRYAWSRYSSSRQDLAYRIYVSDCLKILTQNTAYVVALTPQPQGADIRPSYITARFYEQEQKEIDEPITGHQIAEDVIKLLGLG